MEAAPRFSTVSFLRFLCPFVLFCVKPLLSVVPFCGPFLIRPRFLGGTGSEKDVDARYPLPLAFIRKITEQTTLPTLV
jgi:hypothetical protein